jgi:hypothetical protein
MSVSINVINVCAVLTKPMALVVLLPHVAHIRTLQTQESAPSTSCWSSAAFMYSITQVSLLLKRSYHLGVAINRLRPGLLEQILNMSCDLLVSILTLDTNVG